jgi:hypothetical protein
MGLENVYQMSDSVTKFFEMGGYITNHTNERKTDKIVDNVIKRFKDRSTIGIEKYGTTLYDSPDGFYKFLNHAQEEAMDFILYLEKLKNIR